MYSKMTRLAFLDKVAESFGDPHDWLRNSTGAYDSMGSSIQFRGLHGIFQDYILNYGLLLPAAPIGVGGLIQEYPFVKNSIQFIR